MRDFQSLYSEMEEREVRRHGVAPADRKDAPLSLRIMALSALPVEATFYAIDEISYFLERGEDAQSRRQLHRANLQMIWGAATNNLDLAKRGIQRKDDTAGQYQIH